MICCTRSLGDWSWTEGAAVDVDCSDGDGIEGDEIIGDGTGGDEIEGDETGGDGIEGDEIIGDETGDALDTSKERGTRPTRSRSKRVSC